MFGFGADGEQIVRLDENVKVLQNNYLALRTQVEDVRKETATGFERLASAFELAKREQDGRNREQDAARKPNWLALGGLIFSGFSVMTLFLSGAIFFMNLNIETRLAPILSDVAVQGKSIDNNSTRIDRVATVMTTMPASIASHDKAIANDEDKLAESAKAMATLTARFSAFESATASDLREIETQFCAEDSVRELENSRTRSEIQATRRESDLVPFPVDIVTPRIGRCNASTTTGGN